MSKKCLAEFAAVAANKVKSIFDRGVYLGEILIRLQVWNLFAMGGQIMRAADCKNLSKSPVGDFRQPETRWGGCAQRVRFTKSCGAWETAGL